MEVFIKNGIYFYGNYILDSVATVGRVFCGIRSDSGIFGTDSLALRGICRVKYIVP